MKKLRLNYGRTILIGLAFLSICAFWQMYDGVVPLILSKTFHMNETFTGAIMAADNVLALFLLPLFGGLSDRTRSRKWGRRTPYIMFGTAAAVILMNLLPLLDNIYAADRIQIETLIEAASTTAVSGRTTQLMGLHSLAVVYGAFVAILALTLIAMGTYRSPAVALMPDVTPKPLRSKANAVINLMGAVGGIIYLGIAAVLYPTDKVKDLEHVNYQPLFLIVAGIMVVAVVILILAVREPKLAEANRQLEQEHPEWNLAEDDGSGNEVLPRPVKKSLGFLLASIALWFIGYNGVTTWFTTYIDQVMGEGLGGASTYLLIATAGAIVSYIPIGLIASKVGRKKTIMAGIILLSVCFFLGFLLTAGHFFGLTINTALLTITILRFKITITLGAIVFVLVGFAWAAINVNSLPMVVEMCKGSDVGKFTGFYYTASMAAQVVTPVLAGTLMRHISYKVLFPYAALFVGLSFVTMLFVKHGDAKAEAKTGLDAFENMGDD